MYENEVTTDHIDKVCVLDLKASQCRKYGHYAEAMMYEESARQMLIRLIDSRMNTMSLFHGSNIP